MPQPKESPFYLFSMGDRQKFYYKNGGLYSFPECREVFRWNVGEEYILPDHYTVQILLSEGGKVTIFENETGLYIDCKGEIITLCESNISLPDFHEYTHASLLRILHHEILINIINGMPVPNYFVYKTPWYRDGAMVTMVLEQTNNLHLIKDWIVGLHSPFDRNNKGNEEPDNLGQALYMISCVADSSHPMVAPLVAEAKQRYVDGILQGTIDYGHHPVYAAKWLKYGLEALRCDSSWLSIPKLPDDYSQLFWMDYKSDYIEVPHREYDKNYPYLWWAEQHFFENHVDLERLRLSYPITNETFASEADYEGIRPLSAVYADEKNAAPHSWHAAEMFLYFTDAKMKLGE